MSLTNFNNTQQGEVLVALFKSTASSTAPILLLESFIMGVLFACVPLGTYLLWIKPPPFPRLPSISILWIILTAMITHWALSTRELESTLSGRSLALSLSLDAAFNGDTPRVQVGVTYENYGIAWQYLLSLVAETALFGFALFLLSVTAYTYFWSTISQWRSCIPLLIPGIASLMYALSLAHWCFSLRCFHIWTRTPLDLFIADKEINALNRALLSLLSFNTILSDSIVLWRMCVVWDRNKPVIVFGVTLLVTTLGLNIVNIVHTTRDSISESTFNDKDTEFVGTFGTNSVGLAAAFLSLASNLCATILVGIKAWLHTMRFPKQLRSDSGRTIVERFMVLLVDSGAVYTTMWLLYCISFFRNITTHTILGEDLEDPEDDFPTITTVGYLDAAMAQITTIYPLMVFIFVALDKAHHSRRRQILRNNDWPKEQTPAVTVTFEVDVERNTGSSPPSTYPMSVLQYTDDSSTAVDDTKLSKPETP
ncbi:unnamed protein product [Peniophora sp. CBMAI 1063]|nr:unnamed protein product [Peniophora sp. CBMAI 1063]